MSNEHPQDDEIERQVAQFRELLGATEPGEMADVMARHLASAPSRRRPPRTEVATYRVRITLDAVQPEVWRTVEVPSDVRLAALHPVLQAAMGWSDAHLHQFTAGDGPDDPHPERYLTALDLAEGEVGVPEADVRLDELLQDPGDRLAYAYDFGDGWQHTLTLEEVAPRDEDAPAARCIDGARACPPEDCGGPGGYTDLLHTARSLDAGGGVSVEAAGLFSLTFGGRSPEEVLVAVESFDVTDADDAVRRAAAEPADPDPWAGSERRSGPDRRSGHDRRSGEDRRTGQGGWTGPERRSGRGRRSHPTRRSGRDSRTVHAGGGRGEVGELAGAMVGWADGPYTNVVVDMVAAARLDQPVTVTAALAERMVAPFIWMIDHVGVPGVDLTPAGYLRPADVESTAAALGVGPEWIGAASREGYMLPVLAFRQACQAARLLRVAKGRLHATRHAARLAEDPVALWWHLASQLPLGGTDVERDAGVVMLLDAACHGDDPASSSWPPAHLRFDAVDLIDDHLAAALHAFGWAESDGQNLQSWQVRSLAEPTVTVLERLGVYQRDEQGHLTRRPTPEGVLFARAVLRGPG